MEERRQDSGGLLQSTWVEGSSRAVVVSGLTESPAYARIIPSASEAIFFPHLTCLPSYDQHNTQGWEPRHLSRWPGFKTSSVTLPCETWSKLLNFSLPQLLYLENGNYSITYLIELLQELTFIKHAAHSTVCKELPRYCIRYLNPGSSIDGQLTLNNTLITTSALSFVKWV